MRNKIRQVFIVCLVALASFVFFQVGSVATEGIPKEASTGDEKKMLTSSPTIRMHFFKVTPESRDSFLKAWENRANLLKKQPGYFSAQLHEAISGSGLFLSCAKWESAQHQQDASSALGASNDLSAYTQFTASFIEVAVPNLCAGVCLEESAPENPDVPLGQLISQPLYQSMTIKEQMEHDTNTGSVVLINLFTIDSAYASNFRKAWENNANWMKKQPGYISTQLHKKLHKESIDGRNCYFLNFAVWESPKHFQSATSQPEFPTFVKAYPPGIAQPHLFRKKSVPNVCTN